MQNILEQAKNWKKEVIREEENAKYLKGGRCFIDEPQIARLLEAKRNVDPGKIRDIIQKALDVQTLELAETAALLNVQGQDLWEQIFQAAARIKRKVYDNRIVTFAPLYCSSLCVNNCAYCGFRGENQVIKRRRLSLDEVRKEAEVLAGNLGHKRLIVVFGEHPASGADYICEVMRQIYAVKVKARRGEGAIRRVNVNAASMSIADYKQVKAAGIGTFQIFQETYHRQTYSLVHPAQTIKGDYLWRLYSLHRAMEAGIDDVAIGALFGLYDWRFEVMGLLSHARDLESFFGIGPHTVSFPRLEPAANTPFVKNTGYLVSDEDFKKLVAVLRLSIPYAGMIVTCRENPSVMREVIAMCTQRDASSKVGIGAYSERGDTQEENIQQFILGDSRSLDEVICDLASMGYITSFCTAGYRCGRTGDNIMGMLKSGKEGCLCKLNAVLTFQEWLEDFASDDTRKMGEGLIAREIAEIEKRVPADFSSSILNSFKEYHRRIKNGERDLCF
ncbi:MAG: [FeFe] hydrogenase H-cluster radical SAM maturase HydG [Candidatus Omnitrophica bacterium]|jgi:2-iminoacetate synthase|nr:[FeFe] hydrogenase H-cluster radical SAM maturase HydG [Candidatus Omnitrophota bacterium]